jgi:hypothetical protein
MTAMTMVITIYDGDVRARGPQSAAHSRAARGDTVVETRRLEGVVLSSCSMSSRVIPCHRGVTAVRIRHVIVVARPSSYVTSPHGVIEVARLSSYATPLLAHSIARPHARSPTRALAQGRCGPSPGRRTRALPRATAEGTRLVAGLSLL